MQRSTVLCTSHGRTPYPTAAQEKPLYLRSLRVTAMIARRDGQVGRQKGLTPSLVPPDSFTIMLLFASARAHRAGLRLRGSGVDGPWDKQQSMQSATQAQQRRKHR